MGRLDDIIVRNQHRNRFGERFTVAIGVSVFLLIIIGLMVLTDLGLPPEYVEPPPPPAPGTMPARAQRVDDVPMMRAPPRRPAAGSATPTAGSAAQPSERP